MILFLAAPFLSRQPSPGPVNQIPPAKIPPIADLPAASVIEIPFLPGQTVIEQTQTELTFYDNRGLMGTALSKYSVPVELPPMTSIVATYWWADALRHADAFEFALYKDRLTAYFLSNYRPTTRSFSDHLDFTPFEDKEGSILLTQAYSADIVNWMVIAQLGQTGGLYSKFTTVDRNAWITQILAAKNMDGGFGSLHSPFSTLVETYFALGALDALLSGDFSSIETESIVEFIVSRQRTSSAFPYFYGPFSEFSTDEYLGWEYLWASWLGWEMLDLLDATDQADADLYLSFINGTSIYNENQACFRYYYGGNAAIFTPLGTALIQNTISLLGAEDQFPQYCSNVEALENATYYAISKNTEGWNYWVPKSDFSSEDLFVQAMTYRYFAAISDSYSWQINITESGSLLNTLKEFWSPGGGVSFTLDSVSVETQAQYYLVQNTDIHRTEVLNWVVSLACSDHFQVDQPTYLWFPYPSNNLDPLKVGFYCTQLINRYDLWDDFTQSMEAIEQDANILMWDYTLWFTDQFTEDWKGSISTLSHEGNLEHTWWLLESQSMFIAQNESLTFDNLYNITEISNILQMVRDDYQEGGYFADLFLGNPAQSTFIALRIYELLGMQSTVLAEVRDYWEINLWINPNPTPEELYWNLILGDLFDFPLYLDNPAINNPSVRTWCYAIINSPVIEYYLYQSLLLLQENSQRFVIYIDPQPEECVYGDIHALILRIASPSTLLQVTDTTINGEPDVSQTQLYYNCETIPLFDPDHPDYILDRFEFTHNGETYGCDIPVEMNLEWSYLVTENEGQVRIELTMVDDAAQFLIPRLLIKDGTTPLFWVETAELQILMGSTTTTITWSIRDIPSGSYLFTWDFGVIFLPNITTFLTVTISETTTETTTTNTTTDTTNTTTTTTTNTTT
ncbi:MAG: hypothetical protein E4G98_04525, partial [Promethearchaeota archaeon]